jgi:YaeC family lipoprotein
LFLTKPGRWWQCPPLHHTIGIIVNIVRSVPFIILMIAIVPFTRILVGTSIGINAAVVPLTLAAFAFYARLAESAFIEIKPGLISAADAMGFTHLQAIRKILLPQARSTLIKAAALTYISLVGYAAMAGAVGGGGLGQLAIDYGYERFDPKVMLLTVAILVLLVQLIQWAFDALANSRRRLHLLAWASLIALVLALFGQNYNWSGVSTSSEKTIRLGVMSGLEHDAIAAVIPLMKNKYHVNVKLVSFDDYAVPNAALSDSSIDANLFQHKPFLDEDTKAHGYHLKIITRTFLFPLGFYSKKINNISQLKQHAIVAIASDPSNQGRALLLLEKNNIIKLKSGVGLTPTVLDIINNPLHLKFKAMNTAQLPRVLQDADLVAVNNAFLKPLGLVATKPLLQEGPKAPYANILVVRKNDNRYKLWQQLTTTLHSKIVIAAYAKRFPGLVNSW